MPTFTRENTKIAVDIEGIGRQHRAEAGGMVVALERWNAGLDTAEMFAGLPDGACQEPHFGYVLAGSVTVRYTDGESETLSVDRPITCGRDTTSTSTRMPSSSSSPDRTRRRESTLSACRHRLHGPCPVAAE